jgi:hypothetical protein
LHPTSTCAAPAGTPWYRLPCIRPAGVTPGRPTAARPSRTRRRGWSASSPTRPTPQGLPNTGRYIIVNGVDEGARDDTAARLAGHLFRRNIDVIVVVELLQCWNAQRCRPPLPARDIERIVVSIGEKELQRRESYHG